MSRWRFLLTALVVFVSSTVHGQQSSDVQALQELPANYITTIDKKIDKYSSRITAKTEKTLAKLSRWENKIQSLLQKVNPEAAQKLFGAGQTTFTTLLQKIKEGKAIAENYQAKYDEYRDKLTTSFKYLQEQKDNVKNNLLKPIQAANKKIDELEADVKNSEAIEDFIKERKQQLIQESIKYIGKSKYLAKINKEAYYYVETLKNYKAIFSDQKKAEQTALTILHKIPAFEKFIQQNGMLANLFGTSGNSTPAQNVTGLQTRSSINSLLQNRIASSGPNAQQQVTQNIQQAQAKLHQLKDKLLNAGGNTGDDELPNFKPNSQKTKTILQRLEYGFNLQFAKTTGLLPSTANLGVSIGYKLNDKSVVGIGASYKLGLGTIQHINVSHQGIGLRSFVDWKLKKQLYISGGFEMNYNATFKSIHQLQQYNDWQRSALIGISKKINIKTKWTKGTKLQLLYDLLANKHVPVSAPVVFRIGYEF